MGAESSGFTAAGAAPEWPQGGVTGFPFNLDVHAAQQGTRNGCQYNRVRGDAPDRQTSAFVAPCLPAVAQPSHPRG